MKIIRDSSYINFKTTGINPKTPHDEMPIEELNLIIINKILYDGAFEPMLRFVKMYSWSENIFKWVVRMEEKFLVLLPFVCTFNSSFVGITFAN